MVYITGPGRTAVAEMSINTEQVLTCTCFTLVAIGL